MKQITRRNLDDVVAYLSHEIRAPSARIGAFIKRFLEGKYGDLTDEQKAMLLVISKDSNRIENQANILYAYAMLDSGNIPLNLEETNLHKLTTNNISSHVLEANEKNIQILNYIPQDYNITIDPNLIDQVFDNLISNAVKYCNPSSEVSIELKDIKNCANITIKNEGEPIPEESQKYLFNKFYRRAIHLENGVKGLGLGLYITKKIIEAHDGEINVKSIDNYKNIFTFTLHKNLEKTK